MSHLDSKEEKLEGYGCLFWKLFNADYLELFLVLSRSLEEKEGKKPSGVWVQGLRNPRNNVVSKA